VRPVELEPADKSARQGDAAFSALEQFSKTTVEQQFHLMLFLQPFELEPADKSAR
jgi:hypothetical protein